jgi:hypothetical protein
MKLMTFTTKDIKENIALQLGENLKQDGFTYKKVKNEFICKRGDFTFIFNLLQTTWSDHYSLDVRLYISVHSIEDIYEKILSKTHRLTIGNEIGRIYNSSDGRQVENGDLHILLFQDEDVMAAAETLDSYYRRIAKPYYERYKTLQAIDDIINNPPFEHCPAHVGGRFDNRCIKGLIVARLVNNPDFEKLVTIYDEEIKGTMNAESIDNYHKVKDYLMHNRIK